jgi:hypothetical protein
MTHYSDHIDVIVEDALDTIRTSLKASLTGIVEAIKDRFNLDEDEVTACIAETLTTKPLKPSKPKSPASKSPAMGGGAQKCCGVLKKGGECGKKASYQVSGSWYCGVHTPDKPTKTRSSKEDPPSVGAKKKPEGKKLPPKKGTLKDNTRLAQERLDRLLQKCVKPDEVEMMKINGRRFDKFTRLLFDGNKVYGKLDQDDETILPLEESDVLKLDSWGVEFKAVPMKLDEDECFDDLSFEEAEGSVDGTLPPGEEEITF